MIERLDEVERPLTAREVGRSLGLRPHVVKRIEPAELPYFRVGSRGDRRYTRADLDAYIARRRVDG